MKKIIIRGILIIIFMIVVFIKINNSTKLNELYENPIKINEKYENFTYNEYKNHITIITYDSDEEEVIIPEKINNKKVEAIDDSAFYGNHSIKKVTIPNTVIRIGHQAFIGDKNLKEVIMSDNIEDLGDYAFDVCINLESIYVKKNSVGYQTVEESRFKKYLKEK